MDTINIINNFDQKILMENILILNQKKILDMIIDLFEYGYLSKYIGIENENINENVNIDVNFIKEHINQLSYINWDLFISLMNLNSLIKSKNNQLTNSLFYIIEKKSVNLILFLLELDSGSELESKLIDWDKTTSSKSTLTHMIFMLLNSNNKLMLKFIEKKYDLIKKLGNKQDSNNNTPIYYLVSRCSENIIIDSIIKDLINSNWIDSFSNSIVHWACKKKYLKLMEYLIENNFPLDTINIYEERPIHLACKKDSYEIVKMLIDKKVDLECVDIELLKPINYAIEYGSSNIVLELLSHVKYKLDIVPDIIYYQNEQVIKYILDNKKVSMGKTNFFIIMTNLLTRTYFSEAFEYLKIKLARWKKNNIDNTQLYYINGIYYGDDILDSDKDSDKYSDEDSDEDNHTNTNTNTNTDTNKESDNYTLKN